MSGIGIITNPHSKLNKRNPKRAELLGFILGQQGQLEVTSSLEDLARVAREFKEKGIEILAINGGDGTICRTLTAFIQEYGDQPMPRIAVLKGGTINVLANNLGIRGSPEAILYRLVEAHSAGEALATTPLATLHVDGNYGFLFGNGVAATFLKEYYKRKSGPVGAAAWAIAVWASRFFGSKLYNRVLQDMYQTLRPDDAPPISHSTCAVFCSTVPKMPLGFPLFPKVKEETRHFETVSFVFAARDAIWQLPLVMLKGQHGSTTAKMSLTCRTLEIAAEAPFDFTLDGELYVTREPQLRIDMGPVLEFVAI
jgi:diacylglycerol kinase family enzyme